MPSHAARDPLLVVALVVVASGLLAVGVVSHTELRHLIQVAPAVVAAMLAVRGDPRARAAAAPVFVVWCAIMLGIWLFLLGVAHVFSGTFSRAEIALTIVIGAGCALGLARVVRQGPRVSWSVAALIGLGSCALQIGCLWLSLQPMFEHA